MLCTYKYSETNVAYLSIMYELIMIAENIGIACVVGEVFGVLLKLGLLLY